MLDYFMFEEELRLTRVFHIALDIKKANLYEYGRA